MLSVPVKGDCVSAARENGDWSTFNVGTISSIRAGIKWNLDISPGGLGGYSLGKGLGRLSEPEQGLLISRQRISIGSRIFWEAYSNGSI